MNQILSIPDFELKNLRTNVVSSLVDLRGNRPTILQLWQGNCSYCPPALDALKEYSEKLGDDILFLSIGLEKGEGSEELVLNKLQAWPTLTHYFVKEPVKEELKKLLSFQTVPHTIFINKVSTSSYQL